MFLMFDKILSYKSYTRTVRQLQFQFNIFFFNFKIVFRLSELANGEYVSSQTLIYAQTLLVAQSEYIRQSSSTSQFLFYCCWSLYLLQFECQTLF